MWIEYPVSRHNPVIVQDGQHVEAGDQLTEGSVDPKKITDILGAHAGQVSIVEGVHRCIPQPGCR